MQVNDLKSVAIFAGWMITGCTNLLDPIQLLAITISIPLIVAKCKLKGIFTAWGYVNSVVNHIAITCPLMSSV